MKKIVLIIFFSITIYLGIYSSGNNNDLGSDEIDCTIITGDQDFYSQLTFFKNGRIVREVVGGPENYCSLEEYAAIVIELDEVNEVSEKLRKEQSSFFSYLLGKGALLMNSILSNIVKK